MSATLKYALVSHIKMELMAKMVRWKGVQEALDTLQFLPKKSARALYKVIKSAQDNAVKNANKDVKTLYIKTIDVWMAPKLKRIRFTSRSRVSRYAKYRSFVRVVLDSK